MRSVLLLALVALCFALKEPHYVRTPGGLVWSECMHRMEQNSHVIHDEENGKITVISPNGEVKEIPKCSHKTLPRNTPLKQVPRQSTSPNDGWQVWTQFNNKNNATFDTFLGYFTVPTAPQNWDGGGILYMFTGLQNDDWIPLANAPPAPPGFDIIQPVLQYGGDSENGGGNYWGIASWYVTLDDGALWSPEIQLNDGDVIFGNMTYISTNTWYIGGTSKQLGQTTGFTVTRPRLAHQPWAFCTLEVYEIADCSSDFPPSGSTIQFTQMSLTDSTGNVVPTWQSQDNGSGNHCGTTITVKNPATVTINF